MQNNKVSLKTIIAPSIPLSVLLLGACFILWISTYLGGHNATLQITSSNNLTELQKLLLPDTLLSNLFAFIFTLLNAFLLTQLNNKYTIIRTRTFLPVLIFILLMSSWNETHIASGSHLALTLFIFSLFFALSMFHDKNASEEAFTGSILISIGSIFINPLIFIIPVFWIGFMIMQSFSLKTLLASIIGTLTPWILYLSGLFIFNPNVDLWHTFKLDTTLQLNLLTYPLINIVYIILMAVILIISLVGMYSIYSRDAIHTRNKLNFLLLLLISFLMLSFVFRNQFTLFLPFIGLLFTFLVSHPFSLKQNNFYSIVFIVFCVINIAFVISKIFII